MRLTVYWRVFFINLYQTRLLNTRYMHKKLREARLLKGWSQQDLGKEIGLEQTSYSRKERGVSSIRPEEWVRLAKAVELPIEAIKENENLAKASLDIVPKEVLEPLLKYIQKLELENEN
jgi:transcriptional regulator with XRE-family HTH domain